MRNNSQDINKKQEVSIKPGNRQSLLICFGLFVLSSIVIFVSAKKILTPIQSLTSVSDSTSHGTIIFLIVVSVLYTLGLARLHRVGFRWFTKFNKTTRPDLSWLVIVECLSLFFVEISISIILSLWENGFEQGIDSNTAVDLVMNLNVGILLVLIWTLFSYYVSSSVITKYVISISYSDAFKSSLLNLILFLVLSSPFIAYYGYNIKTLSNLPSTSEISND